MILLGACGSLAGDLPSTEPPKATRGWAPTLSPTNAPTLAPPPTGLPVEDATSTPVPTPTSTDLTSPPPTASLVPTATPLPPEDAGGSGNADVLHVRAVQATDSSWTFHVTVEHPDTGWEDYADGWDVVAPDGMVIKPDLDSPFTRLLLHPHVGEQPFTRSQSGCLIPDGVTVLRVRAHDLVDGFGGQEILVDLTVAQGQGFKVERTQ